MTRRKLSNGFQGTTCANAMTWIYLVSTHKKNMWYYSIPVRTWNLHEYSAAAGHKLHFSGL
jgi:hypothetical protein